MREWAVLLCCRLISMWWIFILYRSLCVFLFMLSVVGVQWFDSVFVIPLWSVARQCLRLYLGLWVETSFISFCEFLLRCVWEV